ncbi:MAG: chromate transporter, partial [Alphaproteobacteria bacterium]|nr:chromate transporter [Alphaproteobacteria bacterium]
PLGFDVPVLASIQPLALALVLLAGGCIFLWRLGVLASLGIAAAAGIFTTML